MTDDIVTRLRDNCACGVTDEFGIVCASCTAADEIERLRTQVRALEAEVTRLERLATNHV